jgi:hypothetical protein
MSTRARVTITDGENELNFYRHSDGYPSGVMPTLGHFMKRVKNGQIRDDLMQAAGWLIAFGINEYRALGYTGDLEPGPIGSSMGWRVGAYEPDPYPLHGDEEYIYILNLKDKTIQMVIPGLTPVYMKGWGPKPVPAQCPRCRVKFYTNK